MARESGRCPPGSAGVADSPRGRLTTYDSFGEKEAWVVISEVLIRL